MKVVIEPRAEAEILESVVDDATVEVIHKGIVARGDCCVDHLCGCSCKNAGC